MADGDVDIASLTEEQQLALQQYTSVTDQDLGAAVPLLSKCQWNVQIAIARFFDGEPAPMPEEQPNAPAPQTSRRQDTLANGFNQPFSSVPSSTSRRYEVAPRVTGPSANQIDQQPPTIFSLFLLPANLLYNVFSKIFGVFSYLFPFLPRLLTRFTLQPTRSSIRRTAGERRPLGPQDTTARFLREFEEEYGAHGLPFLETGYSRAFDLAKRELKFLVVIPFSPEHDDTPSFVREILLSGSVVTYLNDPSHNVLLWAGSVQDSEAYQVASSLNITKFPTSAIIAHTPSVSATAMSVIGRITSPTSPIDFLASLEATILQHSPAIDRARAAKVEQDFTRNLREQQNSAYERSLAQDRERARQKREAEASKAREEKEALQAQDRAEKYARDLEQWRRWRASTLPAEPGPQIKDATRISLRLLNGERVMRKFAADAAIEEVYAFAECGDVTNAEDISEKTIDDEPKGFTHKYEFRLVSPMPRKVYNVTDGGSIGNIIGRSGNLIVERIEADDEVEQED